MLQKTVLGGLLARHQPAFPNRLIPFASRMPSLIRNICICVNGIRAAHPTLPLGIGPVKPARHRRASASRGESHARGQMQAHAPRGNAPLSAQRRRSWRRGQFRPLLLSQNQAILRPGGRRSAAAVCTSNSAPRSHTRCPRQQKSQGVVITTPCDFCCRGQRVCDLGAG